MISATTFIGDGSQLTGTSASSNLQQVTTNGSVTSNFVTVSHETYLPTVFASGLSSPQVATFGLGSVWVATSGSIIQYPSGTSFPITATVVKGITTTPGLVWYTDYNNGTVCYFDPENPSTSGTINIFNGYPPYGITFGLGYIWVTVEVFSGFLCRIDVNDFTILVRPIYYISDTYFFYLSFPHGIVIDFGYIWVTCNNPGYVFVVDDNIGNFNASQLITLPGAGHSISSGFGYIWASAGSNSIVVIDPSSYTIIHTITTPGFISSMVVDNDFMIAANYDTDSVHMIDPNTFTIFKTIPVGLHPTGITAGLDQVWVTNSDDDTVSNLSPGYSNVVIGSSSVTINNIQLSSNGSALFVSPLRCVNEGNILAYTSSYELIDTGNPVNSPSDRRLKTNIAPVTSSGVFIDELQPRTFTWIESGRTDTGFIADELPVQYVTGLPNAVDAHGEPEYQTIQVSVPSMIANMVAELKDLRRRVTELERATS
jgi:streptogramin lyase